MTNYSSNLLRKALWHCLMPSPIIFYMQLEDCYNRRKYVVAPIGVAIQELWEKSYILMDVRLVPERLGIRVVDLHLLDV
jgi:hypothetical protein